MPRGGSCMQSRENAWYDDIDVIYGIIVVIVIAVLVGVGLYMVNQDEAELKKYDSVTRAPLSSIARDYLRNAYAATKKYEDGFITTGRMKSISSQGVMELSLGGYNHVEAHMKNEDGLFALNRGDTVALMCERTDGTSDNLGVFVYLIGCEIVVENRGAE